MLLLAVLGAVLGLFAAAAAVYTVWFVRSSSKRSNIRSTDEMEKGKFSEAEIAGALFLKWTVWDFAVLLLFVSGTLIFLADLLAMSRDRISYPEYHFNYLLTGFVFTVLGMSFAMIRLGLMLQLTRSVRMPLPDNHHEPDQADPAEQRIER